MWDDCAAEEKGWKEGIVLIALAKVLVASWLVFCHRADWTIKLEGAIDGGGGCLSCLREMFVATFLVGPLTVPLCSSGAGGTPSFPVCCHSLALVPF